MDEGQDRPTSHCELISSYLIPSSEESLEVVEHLAPEMRGQMNTQKERRGRGQIRREGSRVSVGEREKRVMCSL